MRTLILLTVQFNLHCRSLVISLPLFARPTFGCRAICSNHDALRFATISLLPLRVGRFYLYAAYSVLHGVDVLVTAYVYSAVDHSPPAQTMFAFTWAVDVNPADGGRQFATRVTG